MALPEFFSRVADSLRPVADVDPDTLAQKLSGVRVRIELTSDDPAALSAFTLACNLAARLYPHLVLTARNVDSSMSPTSASKPGGGDVRGDHELLARTRELILSINPLAQVDIPDTRQAAPKHDSTNARTDVCLRFGSETPDGDVDTRDMNGYARHAASVSVDADGWALFIDPPASVLGPDERPVSQRRGHTLTWLAAAAIGMSEVFRSVFADELGERGRTGPQPGGLDLLTGASASPSHVPTISGERTNEGMDAGRPIDLGEVHLIGAGAIGQAAVFALTQLRTKGVLHVVDPETVTLSNLQRYLLTDATSVGASKVALVKRALARTVPDPDSTAVVFCEDAEALADEVPGDLVIRPFTGRWGDSETHLQVGQALVALDTAQDRIVVAATEPVHAYNAWTQISDLGWSRHENFGTQPCLACLYYPDRARLNEHELIAEAIRQHPLRVLAYLIYAVPIGYPLPAVPAIGELSAPAEAEQWGQVALIEDLIAAGVVEESARGAWTNLTIGSLYRDGICAGGLLPVGDLPTDVLVPMAHQSALAGVMLVAELVWSRDARLASRRDTSIEHRYDVHRGFPQVVPRPRERTPHCLCADPAYIDADSAIN